MTELDQNRVDSLCLFLESASGSDFTSAAADSDEMREISELDEVARMVLEISEFPPVFMTTT